MGVPYSLPGEAYGVPYAAPTLSTEGFRAKLKCIDGVFDKLSGEYSELDKYHSEFKAKAEDINVQLDGCDAVENTEEYVQLGYYPLKFIIFLCSSK